MNSAVQMSFKHSLLSALDLKYRFDYKIKAIKKTKIPYDTLRYLAANETAVAYKIQLYSVKEKRPLKDFSSAIIFKFKQMQLLYPPDSELDQADNLRELEDRLTQELIEREELAFNLRAKRQFDIDFIKEIKTQLDPFVAEHINLAEVFEAFKNTLGFIEIIQKIIEAFHIQNSNFKDQGARGKLFELKCACLLTLDGEEIVRFSQKYKSPFSEREYDLVTSSGKLIECKYSEEFIKKNIISDQANIAKYYYKPFAVFFGEELSSELKEWLKQKDIPFKDNLNKRNSVLS